MPKRARTERTGLASIIAQIARAGGDGKNSWTQAVPLVGCARSYGCMRISGQLQRGDAGRPFDVGHIARPESVVILTATVRAARADMRRERIDGLKLRVSDGGYAVSSKDLAQRVLATNV